MDGRRIKVGARTGTVRFVDAARRPRYFDIHFADGTAQHNVTATFVRNRMLPDAAATAATLHWDLTSAEGMRTALAALMPGTWSQGHVTRLAKSVQLVHENPHAAPLTPTTQQEVEALVKFLDFTQISAVVDPWAGTGQVKRTLAEHQVPVLDNDLNPAHPADLHEDALQPAFYSRNSKHRAMEAIVTSPWFTVLDLALPLAVAAARCVTCVHVPGPFITDAHPNRNTYLLSLMRADRLHILWNLPKGPVGRRCGWLIVFATPALKKLLVHQGAVSAPFSFAT
jgi:hypothetical protein